MSADGTMTEDHASTLFNLDGRTAIVTGGCGLMGRQHVQIIAMAGGIPVLLDLDQGRVDEAVAAVQRETGCEAAGWICDITDPEALNTVRDQILERFGRIDILINNAANNPKIESGGEQDFSRLENFPLEMWHQDIAVGLTGAMLCSRTFAPPMAARGGGVILNIASDLAAIAPDQRLYQKPGLPASAQPVKPVTYSVVKAGLLGLTRYLATYYVDSHIRCNALLPGGIRAGQDDDFVERLSRLIPMARMADANEYQGAVLFMISDASSYMTGATLSVDGGRTCW